MSVVFFARPIYSCPSTRHGLPERFDEAMRVITDVLERVPSDGITEAECRITKGSGLKDVPARSVKQVVDYSFLSRHGAIILGKPLEMLT